MSLGSLSPFIAPDQWDQIIVQGVTWGAPPVGGRIKIVGCERFYKIDQKDGAGLEGATQTYRGKRPKTFSLRFFMWTDAQYQLWAQFSRAFNYDGIKGLVVPVSVYHPALVLLNISAVLVDSVGFVDVNEETKMAIAEVRVREYLPPPPLNATTTPKGASVTPPNIPGKPPNPAIAALQARIAQLQAQVTAQGLPGGMP